MSDSIFFAVVTYDSWHIANGIHQPSIDYFREFRFDDVVDALLKRGYASYLKDMKGNAITKDYLKELWSNRRTPNLHIEIMKGNQEGHLVIMESYTEDCYCD